MTIDRDTPVVVIGKRGFIGSAIASRFTNVSSTPTPETRVLFHFGSYTHGEFEKNPRFHQARILADVQFLLPYCKENGILFVYPSSALVYEDGNQFGLSKLALEALVGSYHTTAIGLRIFPVYGPGESRSVISKWCREMSKGQRPVVYGDGSQERDFIYIDDVVTQTLELVGSVEPGQHLIADVGNGFAAMFTLIIAEINRQLGKQIEPVYEPEPPGYRKEATLCSRKRDRFVRLRDGIRRVIAANEYEVQFYA